MNRPPNFKSESISVTLKFGFQQIRRDYSLSSDAFNSIMERLYHDARNWLYELVNSSKGITVTGRYIVYFLRISGTEISMVPIMRPSDIENNCVIEIILVPAEPDLYPHSLCQLSSSRPTYCGKCSRFMFGFYKQVVRCKNCRMAFHKECAPSALHNCTGSTNGESASAQALTFVNSFSGEGRIPMELSSNIEPPVIVFDEKHKAPMPNAIIDKGVFPACFRGANFYQRYCFSLTQNSLCISAKPSVNPLLPRQQSSSSTNDLEMSLLLTDIVDIALTHFAEDRDDIFEIHFKDKEVISVGKRSDSHELQMRTAEFYSNIYEQREALITELNTKSRTTRETEAPTKLTNDGVQNNRTSSLPQLAPKQSNFRFVKDNDSKDLHERYLVTHEELGRGAYGRVVKGINRSTKAEVAIKIMQKANCNEKEISRINDEISNLMIFDHESILKLEAYFERDNCIFVVTERMEADLCSYIMNSPNGYLDEDMCRIILYQVIVALRYLHSKNCGHLDVKCDNILIRKFKPIETNGTATSNLQDLLLIKLADFGYSRIIGDSSIKKTQVGTKLYNAPEVNRKQAAYNRSADMWSAGIVLYATISGTLPFDEKDVSRAAEIVQNKRSIYGGAVWSKVSKAALDLLSNKLLVPEPTARVRPNEALSHDWFCEYSLYRNLRDIEKRTKEFLISQKQDPPAPLNWLTYEREDLVWIGYQDMYAQRNKKQ